MIFSLFRKTKPPPLTAYCMRLSAPENLLKVANGVITDTSSSTDKRAIVLFLIIVSAAGNFVEGIQGDEPFYKEMRQYLRDTDPDVITAEAIVWITFLMGELWEADQKKDREMFERVGYATVPTALRLTREMIESTTGFDFTARSIESRKLYRESVKDGKLVEAFASVLFRSVGCRSLAEPLKTTAWPPLELVWVWINIAVNTFFSSMPLRYYDTFKNMLRDRPDLFPHDEEDFDDGKQNEGVSVRTATRSPKPRHDYSGAGRALGEAFVKPDVWRETGKLREYKAPDFVANYEIAFARVAIIKETIRERQPDLVANGLLEGVDQYVAEAFAKEESAEALEYYGNRPLSVIAPQAIRLYEENVFPLTQLAAVLARRLSVTDLSTIEIATLFEEVAAEAVLLMEIQRTLWGINFEN